VGGDVAESFHRAHQERYGYADRARPLELVAVRTAEVRPGPEWHGARSEVSGTVSGVVELDGSTAWIPAHWTGERGDGALVVTRA
jgi:hypothetical protein